MPSTITIASKEFSDIVRGKRFIALVIIFGLAMTAAIGSTYLTLVGSSASGIALPTGFLGAVGSNLVTMMSFFAPIMGLALGFDVISGERERGTLKTVLAQPVYRDSVINGKFLAALGSISLATIITTLVAIGGSVMALAITPTVEDISRLTLFMLFAIVFAMVYYGIATFLSTVTKKTTHSIIVGVMLWVFFAFIITTIASLVAFSAVPINIGPGGNSTATATTLAALSRRVAVESTIDSVTPNYHFTQIADYLLNVYSGVRLGIGGGSFTGGGGVVIGRGGNFTGRGGSGTGGGTTTTRTTTLIQSLGDAWPNMLVLVLATIILFVASYMAFTRQEIR